MEENEQTIVTFDSPNLSFPSDVFKWIKLNANPKMALKLMKVCKYFQHSNGFPYLVVKDIIQLGPTWILVTLDNKKILTKYLHTISDKLWITGTVAIYAKPKAVANLLFKTVVFNIRTLQLLYEKITMDEFKALTGGGMVEGCHLLGTKITVENDEIVPLEDILACLPNARVVDIGNQTPSIKSLEAAEAKISSNLKELTLAVETKNFDFETLLAYMKNHQKIQYTIWFCGISNDDYHKNFAPSVSKVIQEWSPDYEVPRIYHREESDPFRCSNFGIAQPLHNVQ